MTKLKISNQASLANIPLVLRPILKRTIQAYVESHADDLIAIYAHGSAVRGDWQPGKSDLDTAAVIKKVSEEKRYAKRREIIAAINKSQKVVPYVEAFAIPTAELATEGRMSDIVSLASTGVCVWGEPVDFAPYLPSVEDFTSVMVKHKIEYLRGLDASVVKDRFIVTRRTAKFAVRVMYCVALLRGCDLNTAFSRQLADIDKFIPELDGHFSREAATINGSDSNDVERAVKLLEKSIKKYEQETAG